MSDSLTNSAVQQKGADIIFECPSCGKSLEIDIRGAGYMIVCPDCRNEIQVPAVAMDDGASDVRGPAMNMDDIVHALEEKVRNLERQQIADEHCFQRLADELSLIQAALDRITEVIESRKA